MKVKFLVLCCLLCFISAFLGCGGSYNQMQTSTSGFQQTNLVSDAAGTANRFDPELVRPRGIAVAILDRRQQFGDDEGIRSGWGTGVAVGNCDSDSGGEERSVRTCGCYCQSGGGGFPHLREQQSVSFCH